MPMPMVRNFTVLGELMVHKYERYLPTAFDESLSLLEKVNKIIEYLNETGKLTNDLVEQWNEVMEWILNEGLTESVNEKLDEMATDGTLEQIINVDMIGVLGNLETSYTDDLVGAINENVNVLKDKTKKHWIDVREYGAIGDGITDDTIALQNALDDSAYKICFIPKQSGAFYLTGDLDIPSNVKVVFGWGASLHGKTGTGQVIAISQKENIAIIGHNTTISMNKAEYSSQYNHGVLIYNSQNIRIEGLYIKDTGGDGVSIGGPATLPICENIHIENVTTDNARRNGISIVYVDGCKVINSTMKNTIGTLPEMGIDVEPNPDGRCLNVLIERCNSYNNNSTGFGVGCKAENVEFKNCNSYDNVQHGFYIAEVNGFTPKRITLIDCNSYSNNQIGIAITKGDIVKVISCDSYLNLANGINFQGVVNGELKNSFSYDNSKIGIVSNLSTDVQVVGNTVYNNLHVGVFISTTSIRTIVKDNHVYNNSNNSGSTYMANMYISNCEEPTIIGNTIRFTAPTSLSITGLIVTANVINGFVKENDCYKGGTGSGIYIESAGGTVNAGNRNKSGVYSTTGS